MRRPTKLHAVTADPSFDDEAGWTAIELLTTTEAVSIAAECAALVQLPASHLDTRDKPVAGTRHLRDLATRIPLVAGLLNRQELIETVHQIVGSTPTLQQVEYRCPQPGFGGQKLHADWLPRTDTGPDHVATAIVALVDFTSTNGATRVVPGSHRRPDLQRSAGRLEAHPDEITLTGAAGTAFVFSGHVLHAGGTNNSSSERPALQLIWHRS